MGRILLGIASNGFQVLEFVCDLLVQPLLNDASPFTEYAQKLAVQDSEVNALNRTA
jgi:hypothetical protein